MLKIQNVSLDRAGHTLFHHLNFSFNRARYGLVGMNGVGKSTLAKILAGEMAPDEGFVRGSSHVHYVPQFEDRHVKAGAINSRLLVTPHDDPQTLSGGEWMRVRLADAFSRDSDFLILDEPTNHLDREGKGLLLTMLRRSQKGLLIISHDREVLRAVDEIIELTPKGLTRFGGGFDLYWNERARARERSEINLEVAIREKRKVELSRDSTLSTQAKRARRGEKHGKSGSLPRISAGLRKRSAEVTTGKLKTVADNRVEASRQAVRSAKELVDPNPFLRFDFEADVLPASKILFLAEKLNSRRLWSEPLNFQMRARDRWQIAGANGSGKSTLLKILAGLEAYDGQLTASSTKRVYLDQDQSLLARHESVFEAVGVDSRFNPTELRNELAYFGFTKEKVHQTVSSLSGGERLRASLAKIFLSSTIPQVLILDEPTNNLDFLSLETLEAALKSYCGLLIVASHDEEFVSKLGPTHTLALSR